MNSRRLSAHRSLQNVVGVARSDKTLVGGPDVVRDVLRDLKFGWGRGVQSDSLQVPHHDADDRVFAQLAPCMRATTQRRVKPSAKFSRTITSSRLCNSLRTLPHHGYETVSHELTFSTESNNTVSLDVRPTTPKRKRKRKHKRKRNHKRRRQRKCKCKRQRKTHP
jgi:hypothetical protein